MSPLPPGSYVCEICRHLITDPDHSHPAPRPVEDLPLPEEDQK